MNPKVPGQKVGFLLAVLSILFTGFVLASSNGVFISKNPAQRFENELRDSFGGKSSTFQAQGVLIDNREFRVTVLSPDETRFRSKPAGDDSVPINTRLDQDCFRALQIMHVALYAILDGTEPGYTDYEAWNWPVTVEWGWTKPGTLETPLKRHTFTAKQTRLGTAQCIAS